MQSIDYYCVCVCRDVLFFFPLSLSHERSDVNRVDFVSENLRRGRRQGLKDIKKNVSRDLGQRGQPRNGQESTYASDMHTRFVHYLCIESNGENFPFLFLVPILEILVRIISIKVFRYEEDYQNFLDALIYFIERTKKIRSSFLETFMV